MSIGVFGGDTLEGKIKGALIGGLLPIIGRSPAFKTRFAKLLVEAGAPKEQAVNTTKALIQFVSNEAAQMGN